MRRAWAGVLLGLGTLPAPLFAQGVGVSAARWLTGPHVSEYRIGTEGYSFGPLSLRPSLQYLRQAGISRAAWAGAGADLIIRTTPKALPYLIGGAAVGLGRASSGGGLGPGIGAWGGVGAEVFAFEGFGLQAEALYTWRSKMDVESVSIGLRIGTQIGRKQAPAQRVASIAPSPLPAATDSDEETLRSATRAGGVAITSTSAVVSTALSVMGTPYRWGGTSTEGFDCSGLIQYAYSEQGISLPRRSVDQAQVGTEIGRELDQLKPGDILTFAAEPGGEVSHVGLYIGEGRFIHSASTGVQTSLLSASDAVGKWWWARWLGARRVAAH